MGRFVLYQEGDTASCCSKEEAKGPPLGSSTNLAMFAAPSLTTKMPELWFISVLNEAGGRQN